MSQHAAFLAAIRENPDDDTPRLAFADWLTENGNPDRAELIRVQIERSRLPADDDRHSELHARELRLLLAHMATRPPEPPVMRFSRFRRGFVEFVPGTAAELVEQLPEVASLAPVRDLWVTNLGAGDGLGAKLAALPALTGVDSVFVDDMQGDMAPAEQLVALFASAHLRRVRRLKLFCGECTAEILDRILALPALQQLESLHVNGGLMTDDAIAVLDRHRDLPIREFRAHKGPYGTWAMSLNGLFTLGNSGHWYRLHTLNVGIQPDKRLLQEMAKGLAVSKIHTLWLHQGAAGGEGTFMYIPGSEDYGIEAFAAADSWGPVRDLRFEYIEMNRGQLTALLSAKPLANLTRLSIFGGMLGQEHGEELLRCEALAGLRTLDLNGNFALGPGFAGALAEAKHLANLTDLRLIMTQGTDSVAEAVASAPQFTRLRNLELANDFISAKGMQALGESPHLAKLNRLRLFEHPVGPWQRLLGGPTPEVLRMTSEATTALATRLPNLACLELHGYEFAGESLAPLLAAGEKTWFTADPRQVESDAARQAFIDRANRIGWLPPLDEYQDEEEPQP